MLNVVHGVREARPSPAGGFSTAVVSAEVPAGIGTVGHERLHLGVSSSAGTTEGSGVLRVAHVVGGVLAATSAGDRFPRRGPFLFPQRRFTSWCRQLDLVTVVLEPAAVADLARPLLGEESFRLQFTGTRPVSESMARYWLGAADRLRQEVLADDQVLTGPLLRAEAFRLVTTALLHAFPSNFLDRASGSAEKESTGSAGVRRAMAFIEERLAEDIGLAEIARMSPRGLQAAFRREKGTTPLGCLRTTRLEAAHRDLQAADPTTGTTVESVAARWGFAHRGRFAAAYRDRYGQASATTLRT